MITKQYTCDICGTIVDLDKAARIKFIPDYKITENNITFCTLTNNSASEKIICKRCIKGIKEAKYET
jgi:hypothetical protein